MSRAFYPNHLLNDKILQQQNLRIKLSDVLDTQLKRLKQILQLSESVEWDHLETLKVQCQQCIKRTEYLGQKVCPPNLVHSSSSNSS